MKVLFYVLFCVFVIVFQFSVVGVFFENHRLPDLAIAFVLSLTLASGFEKTFGWIALTGLFLDVGSGSIFGTTALSFFLIGWAVSLFIAISDIRSRKYLFLALLAFLVALSEIVRDLLALFFLRIRNYYLDPDRIMTIDFFSPDYFFKIIYTIFAAYLIYYIFRKASRSLFLEPIRLVKKG